MAHVEDRDGVEDQVGAFLLVRSSIEIVNETVKRKALEIESQVMSIHLGTT